MTGNSSLLGVETGVVGTLETEESFRGGRFRLVRRGGLGFRGPGKQFQTTLEHKKHKLEDKKKTLEHKKHKSKDYKYKF